MRWFKHLSDAAKDEVMAELVQKFGPEGYGVWWQILEAIAATMQKGSDRCEVTYPKGTWRKLCPTYRASRLSQIIDFLEIRGKILINPVQCPGDVRAMSVRCPGDVEMMSVRSLRDLLTISCPNLLKFRDEYSKKSGFCPESVRTDSGFCPEQDTETENRVFIDANASIVPGEPVTNPPNASLKSNDAIGRPRKIDLPQQPTGPECPHQEIIDLYHQILPELTRVKNWNAARQALLRQRWRESKERQTLDWWSNFFSSVRRMPHLLGENDRGWTADLEWLIRPTNIVKVEEGKYLKKTPIDNYYRGIKRL